MNTLIAIIALGIFCLIAEIFNFRKAIVPVSIIGLLSVLGYSWYDFSGDACFLNNMIVTNKFTLSFSSLFILLTVFLIAMGSDFYKDRPSKFSDFIAIKIFLLTGAICMVSFGNLAMFFLGIEVLSISLYILAASDRLNVLSNEAGMKYFLMGSFASGIILFGICLVYGATGYFDIAEIYELSKGLALPSWFYIGIVMLLIGMLFKIAAVPFHFWAPDVYEGSPALVTTTMSTLAKVTAMASLFKLISSLDSTILYKMEIVIVIVSILSMTVGNIMALRQKNVKRMLAFSGISHAGFMLMALLSVSSASSTLFYYATAYSLAGIAAFAVIISVCKDKDNQDISNFNGLGRSNSVMAGILTAALLSMAGIPIFSGFFAKFMLFTQTIKSDYLIVVLFAVINSIISIGYYFKLILAMYTKEDKIVKQPYPFVYGAVALIAIVFNVIIGLFPSIITSMIN